MQKWFTGMWHVAIWLSVSGCAGNTMVVLMPDPEGHVGEVTVSTEAGSVLVHEAMNATRIPDSDRPPSAPELMSETQIGQIFSEALRSMPDPPQQFRLYFKFDSTKLTAASEELLADIIRSIKSRNSENIRIVGHTDTSGEAEYNMALSRNRAQRVAEMLIELGIDRSHIVTTSHGEQDLLIKTADGVVELRNRRVEIIVL